MVPINNGKYKIVSNELIQCDFDKIGDTYTPKMVQWRKCGSKYFLKKFQPDVLHFHDDYVQELYT
jgi:hypothetical protein